MITVLRLWRRTSAAARALASCPGRGLGSGPDDRTGFSNARRLGRRRYGEQSAGERLEPRRARRDRRRDRARRAGQRSGRRGADRLRPHVHRGGRHQGVRQDHLGPQTARRGAAPVVAAARRLPQAGGGRDPRHGLRRRPGSRHGLPLSRGRGVRAGGPAGGQAGDHSGRGRHTAAAAAGRRRQGRRDVLAGRAGPRRRGAASGHSRRDRGGRRARRSAARRGGVRAPGGGEAGSAAENPRPRRETARRKFARRGVRASPRGGRTQTARFSGSAQGDRRGRSGDAAEL